MHSLQKVCGISLAGIGILAFVGMAYAVDNSGRAAYNNVNRINRAGMAASQRMPTMPSLPINGIGNLSPNLPDDNGGNNITPPGPDDPNKPDEPEPECPDGGVKDSEYTVTDCMNDVYSCVNNGGLPNGINDLFNEDLRNSIENGMALCSVQIEKCVTEIRRNCKNIYRSAADVWIDFNARKVQPDYYNFVLRKTGLTPNQAENTCLLLDRNTYGPSFAAVANNGTTTAEYNKNIGAFNKQQGNILIKTNPQGPTVNTGHDGVDGQRGHYARWDAANADCYIRVAAYNKDTHIKNSWLFGAAGDDKPAEVWRLAGDTFSCNKDLFGFSLMNDTSTAAVVGVGGGTLLGAGVGALAGHGARNFDCSNEGHRNKMAEQIKNAGKISILNEYLVMPIDASAKSLTVSECNEIYNLYQTYTQAMTAVADCNDVDSYKTDVQAKSQYSLNCSLPASTENWCGTCFDLIAQKQPEFSNVLQCKGLYTNTDTCLNECSAYLAAQDVNQIQNSIASGVNVGENRCRFKHLNRAIQSGGAIYCSGDGGCIGPNDFRREAQRLGSVFGNVEILQGEKNNRAKTTLVGAGIGAGAGGIATGITALIEHSNINCRVGDGLAQVGFGKSHSIGTLKDFYVKWGLHLPDTITPTGLANDCNSWRALCGAITDMKQCKNAQINYRGPEDKTMTLIRAACAPSGSRCIENYSVAKSYGACE